MIVLLWPVGDDVTMAAQIIPPTDKGVGKEVVDNGQFNEQEKQNLAQEA